MTLEWLAATSRLICATAARFTGVATSLTDDSTDIRGGLAENGVDAVDVVKDDSVVVSPSRETSKIGAREGRTEGGRLKEPTSANGSICSALELAFWGTTLACCADFGRELAPAEMQEVRGRDDAAC